MAGEFKQQCPSCEAMVSIKDETLVGKKTECTKCKFRFLVEAPSKNKPADDKKAPPVKSKAAGKEAAAKAKQEIKKAESGQKGPKKAGAKNKQMLIIGGAVGGVALVAIVAALFLFSGGEDNSKKQASKGPSGQRPVTPNGPNDKPEENPEEKPKEEEKAPPVVAKSDGVDPDVSIRLPGDSKVVAIVKMESFFNSMLAKVLFTTPGAFNTKDFAKTFGIPLESIEQIMLARSSMLPVFNPLKKNWKMAILRSKEPFKKAHIEKSISLTQEVPIDGLQWSKIAGQLDSLSSLILGFESNEKLSFFLADSRTIVIASEEKMNDYLKKDKGKPKKIAIAAPPPEAPKPVDPNNPMPPMPPGSPMPMPLGSPMPMPPGSPMPMPPGSPMPMPMPNGQPVDPNAAPVPSAPPVSVKGNHFETLPLSFAKMMQQSEVGIGGGLGISMMSVGVDLGELAAVIPIATAFLSTSKTPGGAPVPPDIVNQIKNFSKLEHVLFLLPKIDLDEQSFVLIAQSRDRKVASDFVKLTFPLVKKIPLALKEAKLDISAETEDKTGGDASAAPNPNLPPPGSGGAEERIQPGAHGKVIAVAAYDPITSNMAMGFIVGLQLPPAMLKSFEGSFGEYLVTMKNSFETMSVGKSADPISKAIMGYVNDKKAFPRGTAEEATNNKKFGLKMAPDKRVGWIVELLPYFSNGDYSSFLKLVDKSKSWSDPKNHQVARMFIPDLLYATPTEGAPISSDSNQPGITNFVGISGVGYASGEYLPDNKKAGVFGYDRITKIVDIKDGPANTIALLLIKQNKNQPWIAGGGASIAGISEGPDALAPFLLLEKTNRNKEKEFTGIAIMADGKIREISNKISPEIFRAMCTIDGGEKIDNLDAIAPIVK